jgi:adenine-specific DNA-methyltransferase
LFEGSPLGFFTHSILNPPYNKLNSGSRERRALRKAGIETSNFYSAFIWLASNLLSEAGELVWISPRSFCNGPYFLPFRKHLVTRLALRQVHLFESRDTAFGEDEVLQENVVVHAVRSNERPKTVIIQSSHGGPDNDLSTREVAYTEVVDPKDSQFFIHLVPNNLGTAIKVEMEKLPSGLAGLGIAVSTGRVVDFRARDWLRDGPSQRTAPLIYPLNFSNGVVTWPVKSPKKPVAILDCVGSKDTLIPRGIYVLVKRFSSKEERRRVVAAVYNPNAIPTQSAFVGFENHLNYFHENGRGLPLNLAKGLCAFLCSSLVDEYFRQFNGHTQVNASDLRKLRYPLREVLESLGERLPDQLDDQAELDRLLNAELDFMPETSEPIAAKGKIRESLSILKALGVPREQQNERSALTLLALLDLKPTTPWSSAQSPRRGITEMMDFFRDHYGKEYAPNTRETVRRQTVHQFIQIGLLIENPDKPNRPINSPYWVYQVEASALSLFRAFGAEAWEETLANYLRQASAIQRLQAQERDMALLPVTLPDGKVLQLSQGGQNMLIKAILETFCPRFTPGATVLYVGDAGKKFLVNEMERLKQLGVDIDEHGKMPDVVVFFETKKWLVLIEAVTTHGPVNIKRHNELKDLFAHSRAGLVFVTAFPTRREMNKYLAEIAWETEVWVSDAPSHLIHFNGERFLGPYHPPACSPS